MCASRDGCMVVCICPQVTFACGSKRNHCIVGSPPWIKTGVGHSNERPCRSQFGWRNDPARESKPSHIQCWGKTESALTHIDAAKPMPSRRRCAQGQCACLWGGRGASGRDHQTALKEGVQVKRFIKDTVGSELSASTPNFIGRIVGQDQCDLIRASVPAIA